VEGSFSHTRLSEFVISRDQRELHKHRDEQIIWHDHLDPRIETHGIGGSHKPSETLLSLQSDLDQDGQGLERMIIYHPFHPHQ